MIATDSTAKSKIAGMANKSPTVPMIRGTSGARDSARRTNLSKKRPSRGENTRIAMTAEIQTGQWSPVLRMKKTYAAANDTAPSEKLKIPDVV